MSEREECYALAKWAAYHESRWPELMLLTHNPFGEKRTLEAGATLKRMGTKKGFPDYTLPIARNGYFGMFLEMKFGKGKLTKEQRLWKDKLQDQGYLVVVPNGWQEAADYIEMYLNGYKTRGESE